LASARVPKLARSDDKKCNKIGQALPYIPYSSHIAPPDFSFLNGAAHLSQHCTLLVAAARSDECVKCKLCYRGITVLSSAGMVLEPKKGCGGRAQNANRNQSDRRLSKIAILLSRVFPSFLFSFFWFSSHFSFLFCGRSNENPIKAPVAGWAWQGRRTGGQEGQDIGKTGIRTHPD